MPNEPPKVPSAYPNAALTANSSSSRTRANGTMSTWPTGCWLTVLAVCAKSRLNSPRTFFSSRSKAWSSGLAHGTLPSLVASSPLTPVRPLCPHPARLCPVLVSPRKLTTPAFIWLVARMVRAMGMDTRMATIMAIMCQLLSTLRTSWSCMMWRIGRVVHRRCSFALKMSLVRRRLASGRPIDQSITDTVTDAYQRIYEIRAFQITFSTIVGLCDSGNNP